jgi:hypothetical protein
MEGVLVLATLLQRWRFHLITGQKFAPQSLITLRPRNGVHVLAQRRN